MQARCSEGGYGHYCTTCGLERLELHIHSGTNTVAQVLCVGDQPGNYHGSLLKNASTDGQAGRLAGQILHPAARVPEAR